MKDILVEDIIKITGGKLIIGDSKIICNQIGTDTRKIQKGDTYIGIKGENFNGNKLWQDAFEKGANVVIVEGIEFGEEVEKYKNKAIILVEDTIKALGQIAAYKRSLYDIPVIAITGSVGKTSTKDIIAQVVSQKYKTLKTEGNFNNHIGVPLTLLKLKDHEAAVIEMGMNHEGEIHYLSSIVKPTVAVITNIGTSHIGYLGSRENILKAKLEILDGMENKKLIINNDDVEITTFGIKNESDVMAQKVELGVNDSEFMYKNKKIKVPVGGEHFVYNALCGVAVGEELGLNENEIKQGIETFELTKKRMEISTLKNGTKIINDSYNASYESMQASLKYLSEFKELKKVAVLGDMLELGEFAKDLHKKVGEAVKENGIDLLVCIGELAKYIVEGAENANMNENTIKYCENQEEALEFLKSELKPNEIILFKASNGMRLYDLAEKLMFEK